MFWPPESDSAESLFIFLYFDLLIESNCEVSHCTHMFDSQKTGLAVGFQINQSCREHFCTANYTFSSHFFSILVLKSLIKKTDNLPSYQTPDLSSSSVSKSFVVVKKLLKTRQWADYNWLPNVRKRIRVTVKKKIFNSDFTSYSSDFKL